MSEIIRNSTDKNMVTLSLSKLIEYPNPPLGPGNARKMSNAESGIYQIPNFFQELKIASLVKNRIRKTKNRERDVRNNGSPIEVAVLSKQPIYSYSFPYT